MDLIFQGIFPKIRGMAGSVGGDKLDSIDAGI